VRRDRIEVRGLRVVATHGALPEERDRPQPFELDLDVWFDAQGPAGSDRLEDTVDYGAVVERAAEVVRGHSFRLLEAVAGKVADAVSDLDPRIGRVGVTVRKLRPPIGEDVATVGVRVVRGPAGGDAEAG